MGLMSYIVQWRTSSVEDVSQCMTFLFTAKFLLFFLVSCGGVSLSAHEVGRRILGFEG